MGEVKIHRCLSPYELIENRELRMEQFPVLKKKKPEYMDSLILRVLAEYQVLNMFLIKAAVRRICKGKSMEKTASIEKSIKKHTYELYHMGYLVRYTYKQEDGAFGGADSPTFYCLSQSGYDYAREKGYRLTYEALKNNRQYETLYLLNTAQLNQWYLCLLETLSAHTSVCGEYKKYCYHSSGISLIHGFLDVKIGPYSLQIYLIPYDETNVGNTFNDLLGANMAVKSRKHDTNPVFLILTTNQLKMEQAFRDIYAYPILSSLPIYYAMDLYSPLFCESPYSYIYELRYMRDVTKESVDRHIQMKRKSILPDKIVGGDGGANGSERTE